MKKRTHNLGLAILFTFFGVRWMRVAPEVRNTIDAAALFLVGLFTGINLSAYWTKRAGV